METILVIDDDADSRGILEKKLSDLGSQARFVENADDAERIFQTEKRPLITLAALATRDIDGMELMRRIQAADPDTVIIVLCDSGEDDPLSVKYI
ncbi:MAG: response regulator, partial [FCB group bacterium]|nr:response regulator [FCB group bacterium]